jgi:hypothetical protein
MKRFAHTSTRLVLMTIGLVLGLAAGPGRALADDRPAPADNAAARYESAESGGSLSRPAPTDNLAAQGGITGVSGISRPAPADNLAARATAPTATLPVATIAADGFDLGDAAVGAGFALGVVLLLFVGARVARGHRLLAQR